MTGARASRGIDMNLYANTPGLAPGGGPTYLMPKLNYGATQAAPITNTQAYNISMGAGPVPEDNGFAHIGKIIAAAPIDVVDTIGSLFPGVKRGQINDAVYNAVGMPQAAQFVRDNKGGVEIASGILGAVGIGWLTDVALARVAASSWFTATGLGRVAAPLMNMVSNAEIAAKAATLESAAAGTSLSWLSGANLGLVGAKTLTGALKAGVSEIAIASVMQKNSAIWSEDMSTNLMFAALGVGIGGVAGLITGRGLVYRWANSEAVKNTFAEAADPAKFERIASDVPSSSGLAKVTAKTQPKETSLITAAALNARNQDVVQGAVRRDIQTATEDEMHVMLGKVTLKGVDGVPDSKFSTFSKDKSLSPEGRAITETLHQDPTALYGAASLGKASDVGELLATREAVIVGKETEAVAIVTKLERTVTKLEKSPKILKAIKEGDTELIDAKNATVHRLTTEQNAKIARLNAEAETLKKQVPLVLVDHSWWTPKAAKEVVESKPDQIAYKPTGAPHEVAWEAPSGAKMVMRPDGGLNKPFDQLTIQDLMSVNEAGNRVMTSMAKRNEPLIVQAKPDFWQIDFANSYARRGGIVDWSKSGLNDLATAQVESLRQKALRLDSFPVLDQQARLRLNLPAATSSELIGDSQGIMMRKLVKAATVPGTTIQDLKNLRLQMQKLTELSTNVKALDRIEGNFYEFNRSVTGPKQWMPPVVAFFDDTPAAKWSRFNLQESIQETKAVAIRGMQAKRNAPLVSGLATAIMQQPDTRVVMDVSGLHNSQLPGTAHIAGATASQFLTQAQRFRHTPALQSAQNLRRGISRITELHIDNVLRRVKPFVDQFASISGQPSRVLFNQYLSNSAGWDVLKEVKNAEGKTVFLLDPNSPTNIARLGRELVDGELMPNLRTGKIIALDDLANNARVTFEAEFTALLKERNAVREAQGLSPISFREFFTPPPKTTGKVVGFTLDSANRPVIGGGIVANTEAEYAARLADVEKRFPPDSGFRTMKEGEIRAHADLWDQAGLDFIDPTKMAAPTRHQTGSLFGDVVDARAMDNAIDYLKSGYEQVANGVTRNIFRSQLSIARIRNAAESTAMGVTKGTKNIWKEYEQTLMGMSPTAEPRGIAGVFQSVDKYLDIGLSQAHEARLDTVNKLHLRDVMDKVGLKTLGSVKSYDELADALGPHMPFKDMMDYAAYAHGVNRLRLSSSSVAL
jgi:hypothetical protein